MDVLPALEPNDRQERFLAAFLPQQGTVRAFLRSIVWDRTRCEDLFQETAVVLWREFDRYDAQRPFGAWARGIAANIALKSLRQSRRMSLPLSDGAIQALKTAFDQLAFEQSERSVSAQEDALRHCLGRLPDRARELVHLRYEGALSVANIAARVTSTPEAVQKALSRARKALQTCVERRLGTE